MGIIYLLGIPTWKVTMKKDHLLDILIQFEENQFPAVQLLEGSDDEDDGNDHDGDYDAGGAASR